MTTIFLMLVIHVFVITLFILLSSLLNKLKSIYCLFASLTNKFYSTRVSSEITDRAHAGMRWLCQPPLVVCRRVPSRQTILTEGGEPNRIRVGSIGSIIITDKHNHLYINGRTHIYPVYHIIYHSNLDKK